MNSCAAPWDKIDDNIGVVDMHPLPKFFGMVDRPDINLPEAFLLNWKPEFSLSSIEIRYENVVNKRAHGFLIRPVGFCS